MFFNWFICIFTFDAGLLFIFAFVASSYDIILSHFLPFLPFAVLMHVFPLFLYSLFPNKIGAYFYFFFKYICASGVLVFSDNGLIVRVKSASAFVVVCPAKKLELYLIFVFVFIVLGWNYCDWDQLNPHDGQRMAFRGHHRFVTEKG